MRAPVDRWYWALIVVALGYFVVPALVAFTPPLAWVVVALLAEAGVTVWLLRRAAVARARRPLEPTRLRPLP